MPFDLSSLVRRLEHIPSQIHAFDEQHRQLEQEFVAFAAKVVPTLPYGQLVEEFVTALAGAGQLAHEALDRGAQVAEAASGVVRVGDKVVSGTSGAAAASAVDEAAQAGAAPVAETPSAPEAPAAPLAPAQADEGVTA